MTQKHPLNSCPKCGLFNQSCKCKTLKQRLREYFSDEETDYTDGILEIVEEFLEQNHPQELEILIQEYKEAELGNTNRLNIYWFRRWRDTLLAWKAREDKLLEDLGK